MSEFDKKIVVMELDGICMFCVVNVIVVFVILRSNVNVSVIVFFMIFRFFFLWFMLIYGVVFVYNEFWYHVDVRLIVLVRGC